MKVLHVNNTDLDGRGFNGYDLMAQLGSRGIESKQAVLKKRSDNPNVIEIPQTHADRRLARSLVQAERRWSLTDVLPPWGRVLAEMDEFKEADLVHYHLIHNGVVSLADLAWLTKLKPSVWSLHDPWAFTGHCVYPMDCEGWRTGCSPCPHLDWYFPLTQDNAGALWQLKREQYSDMEVDLVLASEWMEGLASESPLTGTMRRHLIPYGIDTEGYLDPRQQADSRSQLGIGADEFTLLFRATESKYKGLPTIIEALKMAPPVVPTTLITVDKSGLIDELSEHYTIREFGWTRDRDLYAQLLNACDVLLMPSTAEAFGLMAVEAMAAGRPVVSCDGTAIPQLTGVPAIGMSVPQGDAPSLRGAIDHLALNRNETTARGAESLDLAQGRFTMDRHVAAHEALYREILAR